ncbi:MAG TPA: nucleotidyltransferase family protein, partial [Gemmatimonadaceae bacterium]|nr:nucleotidyltransferase family protein [Gemmatimonadaceae bacterium]
MDDAFALLVACGRAAIARARGVPPEPDDAIALLASGIADAGRMLEAAEAHGIVPLVCREVLARPGLLTAEARHSLAGAQQAAAVRALDAFRELRDVLRHLEAADIHALPYKGPVLAFDAYGDVTMRDSADLDIVVAAPDIDRAAAVLGAHGYRPADGRAWRDARATNEWQAQVTLRRDGGRLPLDVHWRFCDRKLPW